MVASERHTLLGLRVFARQYCNVSIGALKHTTTMAAGIDDLALSPDGTPRRLFAGRSDGYAQWSRSRRITKRAHFHLVEQ